MGGDRRRRVRTRVVKRGARGIDVDGVEHPALEVEVVDTTGAGDALAAGYVVGGTPLALETAARCVAQGRRDAVNRIEEAA